VGKLFWIPAVKNVEAPTVAELEAGVELGEGELIMPELPESVPELPEFKPGMIIRMQRVKPPPVIRSSDCYDHEWSEWRPGTMIDDDGVMSIDIRECTKCGTWSLRQSGSHT
jgi:hypothetical protein